LPARKDERTRLAKILHNLHPYADEDEVAKNLELVLAENTFFVVSGQQVGVLGGPLYTLIKLAAIVSLSKLLNTELREFHFIPVFWASGMDHDFDEVSELFLLDSELNLIQEHIRQPEGSSAFPLSRVPVTKQVEEKIRDILVRTCSDNCEVKELGLRAYTEGTTFSKAFIHFYGYLFKHYGVLFVDPEDASLKARAGWLAKASLENWKAEARLINEGTQKVRELGFEPQVMPKAHETNLFVLDEEGRRRKLVCADGKFKLKEGAVKGQGKSFEPACLLQLASEQPERFSYNVFLRPIYQQAIMPVACYVGGPSEVAYWAQLYPLFDFYHIPEPLLIPRPSFTFAPARFRKIMEKYGLELPMLHQPENEVVRKVLRTFLPEHLSTRIELLRNNFAESADEIRTEVIKVDKTLEPVIKRMNEGAKRSALHALHYFPIVGSKNRNR